jgi:hypothetical protein
MLSIKTKEIRGRLIQWENFQKEAIEWKAGSSLA